jgi:FkbM family methyltransferase
VSQYRIVKTARHLLYGNPLFFSLRRSYQSLFDRQTLKFHKKMCDLYSPYIRQDDLVFDIGANVGLYSDLFTELGARVIAVEPNPGCCEILSAMASCRNITIVNRAAGDVPGKLNLHLSEDSNISTLATEWYEAAQRSPVHSHNRWVGTLEVDVITLDELAQRYGIPSFVKIDVEGFDDHVVRGMTFRPQTLTFEFNQEIPQVARRCLAAPMLTSGYEFNYVLDNEMQLASDRWVRAAELLVRLPFDKFTLGKHYGDVFARRVTSADS